MVERYDSEGFTDYHANGLHGTGTAFQEVPTQFFRHLH